MRETIDPVINLGHFIDVLLGTKRLVSVNMCSEGGNSVVIFVSEVSPVIEVK